MKLFSKYSILPLGLVLAAFTSCTEEGDVGDVNEHFLSFEIPSIPCTQEYPVGVIYYYNTNGFDATRYERLYEEPNLNTTNVVEGKAGPWLDLELGNYAVNPDTAQLTDEMVDIVQQHVDWAIEAGIDFFIIPSLIPNTNKVFPDCYAGNERFANLLTGRFTSWKMGTSKSVDLKTLKYALMVDMNNPLANSGAKKKDENGVEGGNTTKLDNKHLLEDFDEVVTVVDGVQYKRSDMYIEFFTSVVQTYAKDANYYRVDGKPMFLLQNMHYVYVKDCQAFFKKIRDAVKERTGEELFLVTKQDAWSPPARFQYFYKGLDAIYHGNMYQQGEWTRALAYPQMIYRNWEYSREYWMNNWNGLELIPNTPVGFNGYVDNGRTNQPFVNPNPDTFRTMCNVSKSQAGRHRLIFIDAWNDIQYASFIEPTKSGYGNGYGKAMLDVVKEEFNVK